MTSISSRKIDSPAGQFVDVRRSNEGLSRGLPRGLTIGTNGSPAHIVDVKVENIRTHRTLCDRPWLGSQEDRARKAVNQKSHRAFRPKWFRFF